MNLESNRLEPVTPATPESWDQIAVGQEVAVNIGDRTHNFRVTGINDQVVTLRIIDDPGKGMRWRIKLGYGKPASIGRMQFRTFGGTNKTIKLRTIGEEAHD